MNTRITLLMLLLLTACADRHAGERTTLSPEDEAYLSMDEAARAEVIASSSPERKFELLLLHWDAYHHKTASGAGRLFAPHFPELRQPFLDYLGVPDPDPDVLFAISHVLSTVYWRTEYDVRGDDHLERQFEVAVNRLPEEPGYFGVHSLSSIWPDTFAEYEEAEERRAAELEEELASRGGWSRGDVIAVLVVVAMAQSCLFVAMRGSKRGLVLWTLLVLVALMASNIIVYGFDPLYEGVALALANWGGVAAMFLLAQVTLCVGCWKIRTVKSVLRRQFALLGVIVGAGLALFAFVSTVRALMGLEPFG